MAANTEDPMNRFAACAAALSLAAASLAAQDFSTSPRPAPGPGAPKAPPTVGETYGTTRVTYVSVPPNAFQPFNNGQTYTSDNFGLGPRWPTGPGHDFVAPLSLPAGAKLVYLELNYYDSSATGAIVATLADCDFLGQNCVIHPAAGSGPADCLIPGFLCSGAANAPGLSTVTADLTPDDVTVSNFTRQYSVLAEPSMTDGSTKIAGMIVGYVLQVSPAPKIASFNDVPEGDFGYQYIEALALSGITGGCQAAPPLFCPDSFVTRRQMAIFLAKALGLQWPYIFF
jgi:hypothetical protein